MKLNIWKNQKEIEKTYECNSYDLMLGTCSDVIKLLELEKYISVDSKDIPLNDITVIVIKNWDKFVELLHDIFPELTKDEERKIKITEVKDLIVELARYTFGQLFNLSKKN